MSAAPRDRTAVALITFGLLGVAALYGWWLARYAGAPVATAIPATTPGGIGEMAITAKVLALGAPIVAAFHGVRLVLLVLLIGGLLRVVRLAQGMRALMAGVAGKARPFRALAQPRGIPFARGGSAAMGTGFFAGRGVRWQRSRFCAVVLLRNQCSPGPSHARFAVSGAASSHSPSVPYGSPCRSNPHIRRVACAPRAHPAFFRVSKTCRQAP